MGDLIPPLPFALSTNDVADDGDFVYTALTNDSGTEKYDGSFKRSSFRCHLPAEIDLTPKSLKRSFSTAFSEEEGEGEDDVWSFGLSKLICNNYQRNEPEITLHEKGKTPVFKTKLPQGHYQSRNELLRTSFDVLQASQERIASRSLSEQVEITFHTSSIGDKCFILMETGNWTIHVFYKEVTRYHDLNYTSKQTFASFFLLWIT